LTLTIVRMDYLVGIPSYRANAAIYRKVTKDNAVLNYDDALLYMQNQLPIARLVSARDFDEELMGAAATTPSSNPDLLKQRFQTEVISRVDEDVKTAKDLDRLNAKLRTIVESEATRLQSNRDLNEYLKVLAELSAKFEKQAQTYGFESPKAVAAFERRVNEIAAMAVMTALDDDDLAKQLSATDEETCMAPAFAAVRSVFKGGAPAVPENCRPLAVEARAALAHYARAHVDRSNPKIEQMLSALVRDPGDKKP
jgi:hypothetical protein